MMAKTNWGVKLRGPGWIPLYPGEWQIANNWYTSLGFFGWFTLDMEGWHIT